MFNFILQLEQGLMPRSIDCHLLYDLASQCAPGDNITLSGIVMVKKINFLIL